MNTIMLIDAPHKSTPWAKPADLSFDEAVELLSNADGTKFSHLRSQGFFYKPTPAILVGFADGSVSSLEIPITRDHAVALLTIAGKENVTLDQARRTAPPELNYARIYSLGVLVLMSLLPVIVGKKPDKESMGVSSD